MAGVPGFEPGNAGTKNRCLTAWLYPKKTRSRLLLHLIAIPMKVRNIWKSKLLLFIIKFWNLTRIVFLQNCSRKLAPVYIFNISNGSLSIFHLMTAQNANFIITNVFKNYHRILSSLNAFKSKLFKWEQKTETFILMVFYLH